MNKDEERRYQYLLGIAKRVYPDVESNMNSLFSTVDTRMKDLSCMKSTDVLYLRRGSERADKPLDNLYGINTRYKCLEFEQVEFVSIVDSNNGIVKIRKKSNKEEDIVVDYLWLERTGLQFYKIKSIKELKSRGYLSSENVPIALYFSDLTGIGYIEKDLKIPNFKFQIYYNTEKNICEIGIDVEEKYLEIAEKELKEKGFRLFRAIIKRAQSIGDLAYLRTIFYAERFKERFENGKFFLKKGIDVPNKTFSANPILQFFFECYPQRVSNYKKTSGNEIDSLLVEYDMLLKQGICFEKDIIPLYAKALVKKGFDKDYSYVKYFSR